MEKVYFSLILIMMVFLAACQKGAVSSLSPQAFSSNQSPPKLKALNKATIGTSSYIRIAMQKDPINTDDILIMFNTGANPAYVFNEDARYFSGSGLINFASLSSDGVRLSINKLPLSATSTCIDLYANTTQSDIYYLKLTDVNSIPATYDVWLMDKFKNDSLDFRRNPIYAFNVNKADSSSYGSKRFSLVIRKNAALQVHLLDFQATKVRGGTEFSWKTDNEGFFTTFILERNWDNGKQYTQLTSLVSSGAGSYTFFEKIHGFGDAQYRLTVISPDGTVIYSKAVSPINKRDAQEKDK